MIYDFDKIISRHNTNSVKWDIHPEALPMWVADMDFETAPAVKVAVQRRAEHGIFGYVHVPDAYYDAVTDWFSRRDTLRISYAWSRIYTFRVDIKGV